MAPALRVFYFNMLKLIKTDGRSSYNTFFFSLKTLFFFFLLSSYGLVCLLLFLFGLWT